MASSADFAVPDAAEEGGSLDASYDCEVPAGELPTRALSGVLVFEVGAGKLTLQDLEKLDGKQPVPLDVVGRLTKIDKLMDPVPDAELGRSVRLRGVTEWSVEYDNVAATVWVSTPTADYKLVSAAPPYASIWATLEHKTLLSARCIALLTENKTMTFGQLRQHVIGLNSVDGAAQVDFGSPALIAHGAFLVDQIGSSEGLAKTKALAGMKQEIRRLLAPPSAAELARRDAVAAKKAEKEAEKEAAEAEKAQKRAEKEAERAAKAEADKAKKAEREEKAKADKARAATKAAAPPSGASGGASGALPAAGDKRLADRPPPPPIEKKRTKFETYAAATSSEFNAPPPAAAGEGGRVDRYKRQRVVLDAPHVLPPGANVFTRKLKGENAEYSNKYGQVLGHDGTDEDGLYYHVQMYEDTEIIRLKFAQVIQRHEVELVGLQARPDLNGQKGYIEGVVEDKGRYSVKVQQMGKKDEWVNVKPANAILPAPARVRLTGLQAAAKYNGRIVKVIRHDPTAGRYEVTMFEDEDTKLQAKTLRLKYENALLW